MNDIPCGKCGEPYTEYSMRHEVQSWPESPDNAQERFMDGDGCPTCDWGDKAGDVSISRTEDAETVRAKHIKAVMRNTDRDPLEFNLF